MNDGQKVIQRLGEFVPEVTKAIGNAIATSQEMIQELLDEKTSFIKEKEELQTKITELKLTVKGLQINIDKSNQAEIGLKNELEQQKAIILALQQKSREKEGELTIKCKELDRLKSQLEEEKARKVEVVKPRTTPTLKF